MNARIPYTTKQFRRNYAKIRKSGKKFMKLDALMKSLVRGEVIATKYKDHALRGELRHLRDCHIEGDWILLYELGTNEKGNEWIMFHATDNHGNLFG